MCLVRGAKWTPKFWTAHRIVDTLPDALTGATEGTSPHVPCSLTALSLAFCVQILSLHSSTLFLSLDKLVSGAQYVAGLPSNLVLSTSVEARLDDPARPPVLGKLVSLHKEFSHEVAESRCMLNAPACCPCLIEEFGQPSMIGGMMLLVPIDY
jgi:hypothetical protein